MKKIVVYFFLFALLSSLIGCANTFEGVKEDTRHNWETMKRWDEKFREKWW